MDDYSNDGYNYYGMNKKGEYNDKYDYYTYDQNNPGTAAQQNPSDQQYNNYGAIDQAYDYNNDNQADYNQGSNKQFTGY